MVDLFQEKPLSGAVCSQAGPQHPEATRTDVLDCHWCLAHGNWDKGYSTAGCPQARRDQLTWLVAKKTWKGAFTFKQRNVFCYLCVLPLDDIGFHPESRCKFSDIVPRTLYALWQGQGRTQVETRVEHRWETEMAWRSWLCEDQGSQCLPAYLAGDRVDECLRPRCQRNILLIVTYQ
jgi:hypothetical protein